MMCFARSLQQHAALGGEAFVFRFGVGNGLLVRATARARQHFAFVELQEVIQLRFPVLQEDFLAT